VSITVTNLRAGRYDPSTVRMYWNYSTAGGPINAGTYVNIYGSKDAGATWSLLDSTTGDQWQTWDVTASDAYTWGFSLTTVDAGVESAPCAVVGLSGLTTHDSRYGGNWDMVGKSLFGGYPVWSKNPPIEANLGARSLDATFTKSLSSITGADREVSLYIDIHNGRRCGAFSTFYDVPPSSGLPGGFLPAEEDLTQSLLLHFPIGTFVQSTTVTMPEPIGRWVIRGAWEDTGLGVFDQVPIASTVLTLNDVIDSPTLLGWSVPVLPLRRSRAFAFVLG
jgi:hypothetical protein